jgi:hypothetical protein
LFSQTLHIGAAAQARATESFGGTRSEHFLLAPDPHLQAVGGLLGNFAGAVSAEPQREALKQRLASVQAKASQIVSADEAHLMSTHHLSVSRFLRPKLPTTLRFVFSSRANISPFGSHTPIQTADDLDLAGDLAKLSSLAAAAPLPTPSPAKAAPKKVGRQKKAMTLNDSFIDLPVSNNKGIPKSHRYFLCISKWI